MCRTTRIAHRASDIIRASSSSSPKSQKIHYPSCSEAGMEIYRPRSKSSAPVPYFLAGAEKYPQQHTHTNTRHDPARIDIRRFDDRWKSDCDRVLGEKTSIDVVSVVYSHPRGGAGMKGM